jgi:hypothetical protein
MSKAKFYDLSYYPPGSFFVVQDQERGTFNVVGTLLQGMPQQSDALESFVLSLVNAGVPVDTDAFQEALRTACDAVANQADDYCDPESVQVMETLLRRNKLILMWDDGQEGWMLHHCEEPEQSASPVIHRGIKLTPHEHAKAISDRVEALEHAVTTVLESGTIIPD